MRGEARVHRRVASQARWQYQEQGAKVLAAVTHVKNVRKRCDALQRDLAGLASEQLLLQESGYFDAGQRESVLRLIAEVGRSLGAWQTELERQEALLRQSRVALARAKQRKDRSEEKYAARQRELRELDELSASRELEDIHINTHRHPSRV